MQNFGFRLGDKRLNEVAAEIGSHQRYDPNDPKAAIGRVPRSKAACGGLAATELGNHHPAIRVEAAAPTFTEFHQRSFALSNGLRGCPPP